MCISGSLGMPVLINVPACAGVGPQKPHSCSQSNWMLRMQRASLCAWPEPRSPDGGGPGLAPVLSAFCVHEKLETFQECCSCCEFFRPSG